jgi:outer membrane protein assembly factor BamB
MLSKSEFREYLYDIPPQQFEELVAEVWRLSGWSANTTNFSGDAGIDVVATKHSPFAQKQLIQVKRYGPDTSVGSPEIQQYASLKNQEENVDSVVVVTSGEFSTSARTLADKLNVKLVDNSGLYSMVDDEDLSEIVGSYFPSRATSEDNVVGPTDEQHTGNDVSTQPTSGTLNPFGSESIRSVSKRWDIEVGELQRVAPTIDDDIIYIGSRDKHLYALETGAGIEQWTAYIGSGVCASPVVNEGVIFLGCVDGVYSLTMEGEGQWAAECDSKAVAVDIIGEAVFAQDYSRNVYAFDPETGEERWQFKPSQKDPDAIYVGGITATPDSVYVAGGEDCTLYAVDPNDGTLQWSAKAEGHLHTAPAVGDSSVYMGDWEGNLYALDLDTGTEHWKYDCRHCINASPVISGDSVYFGSHNRKIYSLSRSDGAKEWSMGTGARINAAPFVDDDTVYTGSYDGKLYAVDAEQGYEIWEYNSDVSEVTSVLVQDGIVYGSTFKGTVFSLEQN